VEDKGRSGSQGRAIRNNDFIQTREFNRLDDVCETSLVQDVERNGQFCISTRAH